MSDQRSAGGPRADRGQASTERGLASPRFGDTGVTTILAREELLDHARHPRNRGELPNADIVQEEANPLCGDVVMVYAVFASPAGGGTKQSPRNDDEIASAPRAPRKDGRVREVRFAGSGCIISQAAASMLTEYAVGKSVEELQRMERDDIETLLGGQLSPSRVKCGMLALLALKRGLAHFRSVREHSSEV